MDKKTVASTGIGAGTALAMTMSWSLHHSIGYAIVHGLCGWFYVIVWAVT